MKLLKFTDQHGEPLYIAVASIIAVYGDKDLTIIEFERTSFRVREPLIDVVERINIFS